MSTGSTSDIEVELRPWGITTAVFVAVVVVITLLLHDIVDGVFIGVVFGTIFCFCYHRRRHNLLKASQVNSEQSPIIEAGW